MKIGHNHWNKIYDLNLELINSLQFKDQEGQRSHVGLLLSAICRNQELINQHQ
ncbi:hypothetical protein VCRA2120O333_90101 [Vibrio crassostreae]|nr:hypothetical protein VCRA2118O236_240028 [Vibrio crassostreae]CAK3992576.1 hypothetical protein VCRA2120O333_90101 [Vibrio crassostreae]